MGLRPRLPLGFAELVVSFLALFRSFLSVDFLTDSVFAEDFLPEAFFEESFSVFGFGVFLPGEVFLEAGLNSFSSSW